MSYFIVVFFLIAYRAISALGDNVTIAFVPSGQGIILDPATLLTPKP